MSELVKWIGKDGGHKIGTRVVVDGEFIEEYRLDKGDSEMMVRSFHSLIRHSHTGELEWVPESLLSRYPHREEWEEEA